MAQHRTNPYLFFTLWIAGVAIFATILTFYFFDTTVLASYGIGVNVAGFILMGLDKSLAGGGALRAPERVLFALALLGGGVGVFLGMHVFRHKTRKVVFQCVLMLIFMAQFFVASRLGIELRNPSVRAHSE